MLSIIDTATKLDKLLTGFQSAYEKRNCLEHKVKYEEILHASFPFNVKPDWPTTKFINTTQSKKLIPNYINKRESYLSIKNDYSCFLIYQSQIHGYYSHLHETSPKICSLCNKLIKIILIAELDNYIEGTTAEELGIAHIDFKSNCNQNDFNELIVHQITHMLLFISDYIEPQVNSHNKNILIPTSGKHKRGGNKFHFYVLFHSLCVGLEVINYRYESNSLNSFVNYHSTTEVVIKRCLDGIKILYEHIELFTEPGKKIIYHYDNLLMELFKRIKYAL